MARVRDDLPPFVRPVARMPENAGHLNGFVLPNGYDLEILRSDLSFVCDDTTPTIGSLGWYGTARVVVLATTLSTIIFRVRGTPAPADAQSPVPPARPRTPDSGFDRLAAMNEAMRILQSVIETAFDRADQLIDLSEFLAKIEVTVLGRGEYRMAITAKDERPSNSGSATPRQRIIDLTEASHDDAAET